MIAQYESDGRETLLDAPRQYGITQQHKHLKEMQRISGLEIPPVFCPIVADFYSGMEVTVPLFKEDIADGKTVEDIRSLYKEMYNGPVVNYAENISEGGFLSSNALQGKDSMQIMVEGNDDRILLIARYDNLGKGASGAAIECLNMVLGTEQTLGMEL